MREIKRSAAATKKAYISIFAVITVVFALSILLQGCSGPSRDEAVGKGQTRKTVDPKKEIRKVKPAKEMTAFYNAVKGADRVIVIETGDESDGSEDSSDTAVDRREQVPLSVFYKDGQRFWDIMRAVTSALDNDEYRIQGLGESYIFRWYKKGYEELGEVKINVGSGSLVVNYPAVAKNKEFYIPLEEIGVIKEAAEANKKQKPQPGISTI